MMYLLTVSYVRWPFSGKNNHTRKQHRRRLCYFIQSQWRSWRCNQLFKIQSITSQFHLYCKKTWILFLEKPDYWFWKSSGSRPNCDVITSQPDHYDCFVDPPSFLLLFGLRCLGASKIEPVEIKSWCLWASSIGKCYSEEKNDFLNSINIVFLIVYFNGKKLFIF